MRELKKLDKVAYIRFASVYRAFEDVDRFSEVIREVTTKPRGRPRNTPEVVPPMTASADDFRWMACALVLVERGLFTTTPNPRVGCVIVRDGGIVGEGWHVRPASPTPKSTPWRWPARRPRRHRLRHPRTLLPPRPHAALRRCARQGWRRPRRGRDGRPGTRWSPGAASPACGTPASKRCLACRKFRPANSTSVSSHA